MVRRHEDWRAGWRYDEFLSSNMSNISNRVVYEQIKRVCCYLQYSHAAIMVMPFLIKYKRDFAGGERKNIHVFLNIWNRNMKRGKEIVNSEQKVAICSSSSLFLLISHYLYNWQYLTMARNFSNIWLWVKKSSLSPRLRYLNNHQSCTRIRWIIFLSTKV